MKREDVHLCWAAASDPWSPWVKPVLFANLDEEVEPNPLPEVADWLRREVVEPLTSKGPVASDASQTPYRRDLRLRDTALVIDLPGEAAAEVTASLIDCGFRPVPLYNAVHFGAAIVDLRPIMRALVDATAYLANVPAGASPAFLLDANRMTGRHRIRPGVFDNRSVCDESDFPSADTLSDAGIRRAVFIRATADRPAPDLEPVLFAWQDRGIELWHKATGNALPAVQFVLERRGWVSRIVHAVRRSFLRRGRDGAYGMFVPEPSAG